MGNMNIKKITIMSVALTSLSLLLLTQTSAAFASPTQSELNKNANETIFVDQKQPNTINASFMVDEPNQNNKSTTKITGMHKIEEVTFTSAPAAVVASLIAEEARIAAEAKAAEDARIAEEARIAAEAKAAADAQAAAVAAQAAAEAAAANAAAQAAANASTSNQSAQAPSFNADPGSSQAMAQTQVTQRGWGSGEFNCLVSLWEKESNWNASAMNKSSGAYGIPQSLPGSKMASAGADWQTNPNTQIAWGLGYIADRYDTPCNAWAHSGQVGWY